MLIDRLIDKIKEKDNPSVAGLDTCIDYLPDDVRGKCETLYDAAKYITDFNFALIDAIKDVVPAVKVQVAYYEMYGWPGVRTLAETIAYLDGLDADAALLYCADHGEDMLDDSRQRFLHADIF